MTTYFISDIHLSADSKDNFSLLLNFLQTKGKDAKEIYILGDLFELWIGDDCTSSYTMAVSAALKALSELGVKIYIMHGNRDFLLGKNFIEQSGCKLINDPCIIEVNGEKVLLTHGDQLCSEDKPYQRFRKIAQNKIVKNLFLLLPKSLRKYIANNIRNKSKKNKIIIDVSESAVHSWLEQYDVRKIIHGHTHKPEITHNRIVLGDWTRFSAKILECKEKDSILLDIVAK